MRGGGRDHTTLEDFFGEIKFFLRNWHELDVVRQTTGSVLDLITVAGEGGVECPNCSSGSKEYERFPMRCRLSKENMLLARKLSATRRSKNMIRLDLDFPL